LQDSGKQASRKPRLSHPLSGADIATFVTLLAEAGPIAANRVPQALVAGGSILGRLPFSLLERLYVATRTPPPSARAPIFIVGHWRSGTTHLYNIMSRADYGFVPPIAAGLPWDFLLLGRLLGPALDRLLPKDRFIDAIPVRPDSPQEDEIAIANMSPLSFYHAIYFPRRFEHFFDRGLFLDGCSQRQVAHWQKRFLHFLDKLALLHGERRIVLKNPVYTARVEMLHALLPQAKFIHIWRDPIEVFFSMRHFYKRLFEELSLQPFEAVDIDEVILRSYPRMMESLKRAQGKLGPGQFVEIGYEDLVEAPLEQMERIYRELELPAFEEHRPLFADYLATVRSYRKNRFEHDAATVRRVEARWADSFTRFGYAPKSPAAPLPDRQAGRS
jgi:hypothetical protein